MADKLTVTNLKKELKNYSQAELIALITIVYKKSNEAVKIINSELRGEEYTAELLIEAKQKLEKIFFPSRWAGLPIAKAKKVISEFDKCCSDKVMQLDLRLFFVECAVEFTNRWGDINESYYNSVISMFWKIVESLNELDSKELYEKFEERLKRTVKDSKTIGWGFGDDMFNGLMNIKWLDKATMYDLA